MDDGVKREGGNLLGLPPRKRFKVLEQQRKELEVESQGFDSSCNDITNVVQQRISPKKLTSQGNLVLEKQKYKSQQQKLQESFVQTLLPLPPRPVAVKRKDPPSVLVPIAGGHAPPNLKLKSPSSSAFKSWSGPPKVALSETTSILNANHPSNVAHSSSNQVHRDTSRDSKHRSKRHPPVVSSKASLVSRAETPTPWVLAKGTTCSTNKAQEDVEMTVCEALASSLDICISEEGASEKAVDPVVTGASSPMALLDLNTVIVDIDDAFQFTNTVPEDQPLGDDMREASRAVEVSSNVETMTATVSSVSVIQDTEKIETKLNTGVSAEAVDVTAGLSVPFDFSNAANVPQFSSMNVKTEIQVTHVDGKQRNDDSKSHVCSDTAKRDENKFQTGMHGPTQEVPVNSDELVVEKCKVEEPDTAAREGRVVKEEPTACAQKGTIQELSTCSSQLVRSCTAGSSIVALVENHTSDETSSNPNLLGNATVFDSHTEDTSLLSGCDKGDMLCAKKQQDEVTVPEIADALHSLCDLNTQEDREQQATASLSGALVVIEDDNTQKTDAPQNPIAIKCTLLADLDEQAEQLFKRMFKREENGGCCVEPGRTNASSQIFFDAGEMSSSNRVNVDSGKSTTSNFQDLGQASTSELDGQKGDVRCSQEGHQIQFQRPAVNVVEAPSTSLPTADSPCRVSQRDDRILCSEGQQPDSTPSAVSKNGGVLIQELFHEADCKSSKEDSGWDSEMEIPDFSFGIRSGMTQRVKAPGRWTETTVIETTNVEEVDEEGACDVCCSADATSSDPIVYCDGCDVAVHADCYGNPLHHGIPEGDWFCAQCQSRSSESRSCCLCPRSGGAMKMTTDGNWAHISCAVFVPEVCQLSGVLASVCIERSGQFM